VITEEKLRDMKRLDLRRLAMQAGMERKPSGKLPDNDLIDYILENHQECKSNGAKKVKPKPPKPLSDKEKAAKEGASDKAPVKKRRGRPPKKKTEEKATVAAAPPSSDLADLVNRLDVIGNVVDDLRKVIDSIALATKHNQERLVDMEGEVQRIHKASFHIYTATVDAAETWADIDEAPDRDPA